MGYMTLSLITEDSVYLLLKVEADHLIPRGILGILHLRYSYPFMACCLD